MSVGREYVWRLQFKLKMYATSGRAFEQLFHDLMTYRNEDFEPIRPSGKWGDRGNDGFVRAARHFFQVYAPQAATKLSPSEAAKMALEDFGKLKAEWEPSKYTFVLNDRFEGIPALVSRTLSDIRKLHAVEANAWGARRLMGCFRELDADGKAELTGAPLAVDLEIPDLDTSRLGEVLRDLARRGTPPFDLGLQGADFDEKIAFNQLCSSLAAELRSLSRQVYMVDEFLDVELGLAQDVGQEIHRLWAESLEVVPASDEEASSLQYIWIKQQMIPPEARGKPYVDRAYNEAAGVIMAKYFETCDIFNRPEP